MTRAGRLGIGAALAAYLAFLVEITQRRFFQPAAGWNLVPFATMAGDWRAGGRPFLVNFLGNLAVFVPIGALLPLAWPRRWTLATIAGIGLALSLLIEAGQYATGHRMADVDDVILNTAGAAIGYAIHRLGRGARRAEDGSPPEPDSL